MLSKGFSLAISACLFLLFSTASAQTPDLSLSVAGVSISLEMSRGHVFQLFKAANIVTAEAQDPDQKPQYEQWVVCEQGQRDINTCNLAGSVHFADGHVSLISARWGTKAMSAPDSALALYGAVQDFKNRGLANCKINTHDTSDQEHNYKSVTLNCGHFAYISITNSKNLSGPSTLVIDQIISDHDLTGLD